MVEKRDGPTMGLSNLKQKKKKAKFFCLNFFKKLETTDSATWVYPVDYTYNNLMNAEGTILRVPEQGVGTTEMICLNFIRSNF